ncbi:MAG TPA: hydrogenase nickel insertion protein HypA [Desulfotomaculum sp.]|nr:MAG: Zn finger protein HypA/HybF [Desulfotomaculum sp. 46_80]KUK85053.1 MAG: Zn finger protein HypA/HybF [Desulfofundulus kuznetsovii]HAG10930.1 hydrogenase nickel insertion protein HypA [Desulfotomaculum sp.]HBY03963.1 hydrogenase nickel insertion protein HypA [Desulfotomaculum sp.]
MHEWALAEAVIVAAHQEAEKQNIKQITKVQVKIGELQQIDLDIFKFALENIKEIYDDLSLDADVIDLEVESSTLKCKVCGKEWEFRDLSHLKEDENEAIHFIPETAHVFMRCPGCGTPDFEIVKGRGVWIQSIEGVL